MRRYVIIGSGAAGIAAIEAIRSKDIQGEIILIAEDRHGYYSRPGLAYLLSREIPESGLFPFSKYDFTQLHVTWIGKRAVRINPATHRVYLHDGGTVPYDRLLIATGSRAVRLSIPGVDLEGSVKLDELEDARQIIKLSKRGKTAVVVGGGITALEIVEGFIARGVKVHYFLRDDRYWKAVLEENESRIIEERLRHEGVKIHYHTELVEILGKRGRVVGVRTKKEEMIRCDIVAIAIGVKPRLEVASSSEVQTDRGIIVDDTLQTNIADIYAAGDVAQVYDSRSGKYVLDTLWSPARFQGQNAGLNMAGYSQTFSKPISFNVTRLAGLTTTIIGSVGTGGRDMDMVGIARGDSESWRETPGFENDSLIESQSDFDVNRIRLLLGNDTLVGAFIMGDQSLSNTLQKVILNQINIASVRERLLKPGNSLSDTLLNIYHQWQRQNAV